MNDIQVDVLIIGGGVAGLATADTLFLAQQDPGAPQLSYCVLEGRDRVGGRTHTMHPELGHLDMGGEFIGPFQLYSINTARRLGIEMMPLYMPDDTNCVWQYADGTIDLYKVTPTSSFPENRDVEVNMVRVEQLTGQLKMNLNDPWTTAGAAELDTMSVQAWIDQHMTSAYGKQIFEVGARSALSVEPSEMSVLYMMWYAATCGTFEALMSVNGGSDCIRLVYGMQQFSEKLADEIGREHVHMGVIAKKVSQDDHGVCVETECGKTYRAKRLVIAMSPPMVDKITFDPPLTTQRQGVQREWKMGRTIKGFVCYKAAWWRENFTGYTLSAKGPVSWTMDNTWLNPKTQRYEKPSLMTFIVGDEADAWHDKPHEELKAAVLDHLVEMFDDERAKDPSLLVGDGYYRVDWRNEPLSGGCPAAVPTIGAFHELGPALRAPVGRVHWAGSETATDWAGGYINGALQSGQRVALELLTAFAADDKPPSVQ